MAKPRKAGDRWRVEVRRRGVYASETFRTKAEATRWALEQEMLIDDGKVGKIARHSLREALEKYKAEVTPGKRGWRPEGLRIDKFIATIPFIDKPLTEIGRGDWSAWRDSLAIHGKRRALSAGSIIRDFNILRHMHALALDEWGWLKVNPLLTVKNPAAPPGKTRVITASEAVALCAALGYTDGVPATKSQRVALGMLFALETGMRAGEVFGLLPANIDYSHRCAHLPLTKNGTARDVPLSSRAAELLRLAEGEDTAFGVSTASADALFRKYRPPALASITFHATRHTAASRLGASGKVTPHELCAMFGWTDLKMSMRYFHASASDIAAKLD